MAPLITDIERATIAGCWGQARHVFGLATITVSEHDGAAGA